MSGSRIVAAAGLTGYVLITSFAHLEVSLWLVRRRTFPGIGEIRFADLVGPSGLVLLALFVAWQIVRARGGTGRRATLSAWAAWAGVVIAVDRTLIYSLPEYLHYPQYGLLAWLMARFADPDRSRWPVGSIALAVTLLGIADETLQYLWITVEYSNYWDFNDFLLNLLGACAGLLAYYGFEDPPDAIVARRQAGRGALGFAALGVALLLVIAIVTLLTPDPEPLVAIEREISYGRWIPGPRAGRYFVLPPLAGALLMVALGWAASVAPLLYGKSPSADPEGRQPASGTR